MCVFRNKMLYKRIIMYRQSNMNQVIMLCMFGFICVVSCYESKNIVKSSQITPSTRQIKQDEVFSVAKNVNRKYNYSETFSMQNEISPSSIKRKDYENYKLLSITISCFDKNNTDESEMLSDGQEKKIIRAKYKYENILRLLQDGKLAIQGNIVNIASIFSYICKGQRNFDII